MSKRFYVYVHKYASGPKQGQVFYVGKGNGNRAFTVSGRNRHWKNIVHKYGFIVEILKRFEHNKCALTYERLLIYSIGRENLCNLTDGGEGTINPSAETRKKMSIKKVGIPQKPEHAQKSRTAKLGKQQPLRARLATSRIKSKPIINSDGEIFRNVATAVKELSSRLGFPVSQGNISTCARGSRNNAYGLTWSYDTSVVPKFKPTPSSAKPIMLVCRGVRFASVMEAVKYIEAERGVAHNQCISQAARTGGIAYGYKWKYVDNDNKTKEAPRRLHK